MLALRHFIQSLNLSAASGTEPHTAGTTTARLGEKESPIHQIYSGTGERTRKWSLGAYIRQWYGRPRTHEGGGHEHEPRTLVRYNNRTRINCKYINIAYQRVCPLLLAMTLAILSGILSYLRNFSGDIFAHSSNTAAFISSVPFGRGLLSLNISLSSPYTFSIGFRSGEAAGQSKDGILYHACSAFVISAVCAEAPSSITHNLPPRSKQLKYQNSLRTGCKT